MHDASRTTSPSCAVGFRDVTAVVRATYPSPECRGFSPRQLHLRCGRCGSSFRSATDSLHPSAERAPFPHAGSDVPCRAIGVHRVFQLPADAQPLRRTGRHADRTRPVGSQCLLRPTRSPTETPLVGSIPTLPPGWWLSMVKRFSQTNRQPLTPLSRIAVQAGPSRSRPPRCRYSLSCPQRTNALGRPSRRRCLSPTSATEQLSRAPWGTHALEHRARTLPTSASGAAPFRRLLCRRGNDPFRTRRRRTTTGAVRPRVAPRLAPLAPAGARPQPAAVRTVARTVSFFAAFLTLGFVGLARGG